MPLGSDVLAILVCPVPDCRGALRPEEGELVCTRCGLRYPLDEVGAVLIPEEARSPCGS